MSFWLLIACGLIAANMSVYKTIFASRLLEVSVLEVGKGSATLVRTPRGKTILIDTGPDASILRALGEALPAWQRDIDTIVLTSDKPAQTNGLASIESRYQIGEVLRAGTTEFPYGTTISFDTIPIDIIAPGKYELK